MDLCLKFIYGKTHTMRAQSDPWPHIQCKTLDPIQFLPCVGLIYILLAKTAQLMINYKDISLNNV